jgi:hypothetical protein
MTLSHQELPSCQRFFRRSPPSETGLRRARGNYWRREVWFRSSVVYRTDGKYYLA